MGRDVDQPATFPAMPARAFLLKVLLLGLAPACAQEVTDYVRPPREKAIGADIFGPIISVLPQQEQRLRMEFVYQHWYREKRAWRASFTHVDERYPATNGPLELIDGLIEERRNTERYTMQLLRGGLQAQHRHKRISGLVAVAFQVGRERSRLMQDVDRFMPDTLPCAPCELDPVDGTRGLELDDHLLLLGLEAAVGMSGRLGERWEIEFRFPLQVRWRMLMSREEDVGIRPPQGWDDRVRFGAAFPGLFVFYTW